MRDIYSFNRVYSMCIFSGDENINKFFKQKKIKYYSVYIISALLLNAF